MKETNTSETFLPDERILSRIFWVRGRKVMFDSDLAKLYGVEIRELNQAVKRNDTRFPEDFMFQLSEEEYAALRSQIVILNSSDARTSKRGLHRTGRRHAFKRAPKRKSGTSQHPNHPNLHETSRNSRNSQRTPRKNRAHGKQIRQKIQSSV